METLQWCKIDTNGQLRFVGGEISIRLRRFDHEPHAAHDFRARAPSTFVRNSFVPTLLVVDNCRKFRRCIEFLRLHRNGKDANLAEGEDLPGAELRM